MTNNLLNFHQVKEVLFANEAQKLINEGWSLAGVHQRSRIYDNGVEADVVYVLVKERND